MHNSERDKIKNVFPFFEEELVYEIIQVSDFKKIKEGDNVIEEGNYIKSFPMVLSGCLRVSKVNDEGNELLLYYLKQGEICAMALTCCIGMQKSNIMITAIEDSEILAVPIDKPEKWMGEFRTWKEFMMYSYRKRFEELLDAIDAIAFRQMDERLIRFFLELYRSTGKTVFKGTHNDIAIQLNTSREVVSRLLSRLEKENKVVTRRNLIDYTNLVK
ncbi:MAG: Crp/Fnr family transcriptional regulator [Bacteroidales bacterium]